MLHIGHVFAAMINVWKFTSEKIFFLDFVYFNWQDPMLWTSEQ